MDTAIQRTNERIAFFSQDKEELRRYHLREMGIADWNGITAERDQAVQALAEAKARIAELEAQINTQ